MYQAQEGTAIGGTGYTAASGSIIIPAGIRRHVALLGATD